MPKLYYTPSSCGASSFISAYIAKLNFECEAVDLATHITESGIDFYSINPKGNVPSLVLDDGTVLNENISCLNYIADRALENGVALAPKIGSNERYVLDQQLSFLSSELHSTIGMLFNPSTKNDDYLRNFVMSIFDRKMKYLQKHILNQNRKFVYGNSFTIIDAYLHIILSWTYYVNIDLSKYPVAHKYFEGICNIQEVKNSKKRMADIPSTIWRINN